MSNLLHKVSNHQNSNQEEDKQFDSEQVTKWGKSKSLFGTEEGSGAKRIGDKTAPVTHTIVKGDTFWELENKYGLEHGTLQKYNPELDAKDLKVGTKVNLIGTIPKTKPLSDKGTATKQNGQASIALVGPLSVTTFAAVTATPATSSGWFRDDGTPISQADLKKVKVYIFHDDEFPEQALVQYADAVRTYGKFAVALSNSGSSTGFKSAWANMDGEIKQVMIMMHGKNQSIRPGKTDQLTATGNGKTNIHGNKALNIQDLPKPKGNIGGATLFLYSCHAADTEEKAHGEGDSEQGDLKGTKETVAEAFAKHFGFKSVIGTAGAVNYHSTFTDGTTPLSDEWMHPYPEDGNWINYVKPKGKPKKSAKDQLIETSKAKK